MFQGLTAGMPVYIYYKNTPQVVEARVVNANTHPQMPNPNNPMAILNGPVTDLTVSVDGKNLPPFLGLSPQAMMASFSNEGMFLSEDMGLVKNEIKSERDKHQRIVECYKPSKEMVSKLDSLLLTLDPDRMKEAERDKEMSYLKDQLAENNSKLEEMMALFSAVLGKKKPKEE